MIENRKIDDINEEDIMKHMMLLVLKHVNEKNYTKELKKHELQILHSIHIRVMIAKGFVLNNNTNEVYQIYQYLVNNKYGNKKILTQQQLTQTLTKYYGFKVVYKRINRRNERVFEINDSNDYLTLFEFFKDIDESDIINMTTFKIYEEYKIYCIKLGLLPINKGEFSKQVKKYFNFTIIDKKIQGKKCRIFIKVQEGSR